jgi:acyl carrier protein
MTRDEVESRVATVFAAVFAGRLSFSRALTRTDHEYWTSLKHMELLVALEAEFGVRFDGADAVDMQSIETVIERVAERTE